MLASTRRALELIRAAGKSGIARSALNAAMAGEVEEHVLGFRLTYLRQQGYIDHMGAPAHGRWFSKDVQAEERRTDFAAERELARELRRTWPKPAPHQPRGPRISSVWDLARQHDTKAA
jgi:hypothetical protein